MVLIDPPFEEQGEFQRLVIALEDAARRFATGTVIVWYPVKDRAAVGRFHAAIRSSRLAKVLMVSLAIRGPDAAASGAAAAGFRGKGLGEAGLVVVNPPYTLHDDLAAVLPTLRDVLAEAPGYGFQLEWLVAERAKA